MVLHDPAKVPDDESAFDCCGVFQSVMKSTLKVVYKILYIKQRLYTAKQPYPPYV